MSKTAIFSIGHGNKEIDKFIKELKSCNIKYLLDIRTKPFSKWNPQFNKESLKQELKKSEITYVFVGDVLGGLPDDRSCYDLDGKVVYDLLKEKDFFKSGIKRLITASEKNISVAIMCSESKPEECHRSKLIGQELTKIEIPLIHIISENEKKTQQEVINELTKGQGLIDMFGETTDFTSRKSY